MIHVSRNYLQIQLLVSVVCSAAAVSLSGAPFALSPAPVLRAVPSYQSARPLPDVWDYTRAWSADGDFAIPVPAQARLTNTRGR
jgi:hypothetical protein